MIKNTIIVSLFNLLGFGLSFVVNLVISSKFGAGYNLDTYITALLVPSYIVSILSVILSYTFIPIYSKYNIDRKDVAWEIAVYFLNLVLLFLIVLCVILFLFSDRIIALCSPGFKLEQIKYASVLMRIYIPIIFFTALNELIASIFYSNNKFIVPLVNKIVSPILTILFVVFFSSELNVKSIIFASLIASIIQFTLLLYQLNQNSDFKYKFKISIKHPGMISIFKLLVPLLLSAIFYKLFPIIDAAFLSTLNIGDISRINYANKLQLVIGTIISSVFSVQVFALFSQLSAQENFYQLKLQSSIFIRLMLFISIPIAMLIFIFSEDIVSFVFERGAFNSGDTKTVSKLLKLYILALPAISIGNIISQLLYAMREIKAVLIIGLIEVVFYVTICYTFLLLLKAETIPFAYMLNFNFSVLALAFIVRKKINLGGGTLILKSACKFFSISLFICYCIFYVKNKINIGVSGFVFLAPFGFLLYYLTSSILNFTETIFINEKIKYIISKIKK